MHYKTSSEILSEARHARDWLEQIGVKTDGTRLERIQLYLQGIESDEIHGALNGLDAYYALSDGAGFGSIATALSKLSSNLIPRGTLRDVPSKQKKTTRTCGSKARGRETARR